MLCWRSSKSPGSSRRSSDSGFRRQSSCGLKNSQSRNTLLSSMTSFTFGSEGLQIMAEQNQTTKEDEEWLAELDEMLGKPGPPAEVDPETMTARVESSRQEAQNATAPS